MTENPDSCKQKPDTVYTIDVIYSLETKPSNKPRRPIPQPKKLPNPPEKSDS